MGKYWFWKFYLLFAPICQESLKLDLNDLIGWMVKLRNQASHFMHGYAHYLELFQ